jgi:hypothetical protein
MNKQAKLRWFSVATAAALVAATAGCAHKLHGEQFQNDDEARAVRNVAGTQAAVGARADATLHSSHFNTSGLNSLGRDKLDLMLLDEDSTLPLVVYLDLPRPDEVKPDEAKSARQAVTDYLKGRGMPETQFKLVEGPNPHTLHSATEVVNNLQTLRSTTSGGAGGATPNGQANSYSATPMAPVPDTASH